MQSKKNLVAELRALRQENADLRRQLRLAGKAYTIDDDVDAEAATEIELTQGADKLLRDAEGLASKLSGLTEREVTAAEVLARRLAETIRAAEELPAAAAAAPPKYGRPPKYTDNDAMDILHEHQQGATIRALATSRAMSTTTVQKMIRRGIELGG